VKRLFDILVSAIALIVLSPVMIIVAVAIFLTMGSPVLFRQVRPGLNGNPFEIIKFRSMRDATDKSGKPLADADRLTKLGLWLRSTSLDELPELWSILLGDMSFVGPRPLLSEYLPLYSKPQARRHEVRPGLTGWAQVNGRNLLDWDEKFQLDVWYVDNRSLMLDIKIIGLTLVQVVRRQGISAVGEATMPKFRGGKPE
jgi:sugar transferase EpsL